MPLPFSLVCLPNIPLFLPPRLFHPAIGILFVSGATAFHTPYFLLHHRFHLLSALAYSVPPSSYCAGCASCVGLSLDSYSSFSSLVPPFYCCVAYDRFLPYDFSCCDLDQLFPSFNNLRSCPDLSYFLVCLCISIHFHCVSRCLSSKLSRCFLSLLAHLFSICISSYPAHSFQISSVGKLSYWAMIRGSHARCTHMCFHSARCTMWLHLSCMHCR